MSTQDTSFKVGEKVFIRTWSHEYIETEITKITARPKLVYTANPEYAPFSYDGYISGTNKPVTRIMHMTPETLDLVARTRRVDALRRLAKRVATAMENPMALSEEQVKAIEALFPG